LNSFLTWADEKGEPVLLNAGELTDSCAIPAWTRTFLSICIKALRAHPIHKVLLVTKGGEEHIKPLLEISVEDRKFFVVSFSVNAAPVALEFERGPPDPFNRIRAAKICQENGYEVRIRIDPIIPVKGWKEAYQEIVEYMFVTMDLKPSRVTLGTLRGLAKTIRFSKERSWVKFLKGGEKTGWGLKMPKERRLEVYGLILDMIRNYYSGDIALCKETPDIWRELGLPDPGEWPYFRGCKCNCVV